MLRVKDEFLDKKYCSVTGVACTGKTSSLEYLKKEGYPTIPGDFAEDVSNDDYWLKKSTDVNIDKQYLLMLAHRRKLNFVADRELASQGIYSIVWQMMTDECIFTNEMVSLADKILMYYSFGNGHFPSLPPIVSSYKIQWDNVFRRCIGPYSTSQEILIIFPVDVVTSEKWMQKRGKLYDTEGIGYVALQVIAFSFLQRSLKCKYVVVNSPSETYLAVKNHFFN